MKEHKGVAAIITTEDRDKFYMQFKGNGDTRKNAQDRFSFWGGEIEDSDKDEAGALERELVEEIPAWGALLAFEARELMRLKTRDGRRNYDRLFYEVVLPDRLFARLVYAETTEGKGMIIPRGEMHSLPFAFDLAEIWDYYIDNDISGEFKSQQPSEQAAGLYN